MAEGRTRALRLEVQSRKREDGVWESRVVVGYFAERLECVTYTAHDQKAAELGAVWKFTRRIAEATTVE